MGASKGCIRVVLSFCVLFGAVYLSNALECEPKRKKNFLTDLLSARSCPGIGDDSDEVFCCERGDGSIKCCDFEEYAKSQGPADLFSDDSDNDSFKARDEIQDSAEYLIPVLIGVVVGIVVACFICCLCCPCCMLYKRRHRGTVYGRVQQPAGNIVNVQTYPVTGIVPPNMPQQVQQQHSPMPMMHQPIAQPLPQQMPMPQPMQMPVPQPGTAAPYPAYPPPDFSGHPQMPPPPYSAAVAKEGYATQAPYNPHFGNQ